MVNRTNDTCRKHDALKIEVEMAFFPIYSMMFVAAVCLNSLLLYVVIKKENFVNEKRSFHRLFQLLIAFDLFISILMLPQIIIKLLADDRMASPPLDAFVAIRDFCISSQMIILVLIAVDRLLAYLLPLSNFWRLRNVMICAKTMIILIFLLYILRFVLLSIPIECLLKKSIDKYGKLIIGLSGGVFMLTTLMIYVVLFTLLCKRQITRQRQSMSSIKFYKANQNIEYVFAKEESSSTNNNNNTVENKTVVKVKDPSLEKSRSRTSLAKLSFYRQIGSIKFAKVLLLVNVLMIASYLPAILYNNNIISFPTYTVYYLFFLHALGDPIIFFLTRPELKKGLVSMFVCK